MQNIVVKMTAIVDEAGRDISEDDLALQKMAVGELANRPAGMHQALASYCGNKTVSGMPMARWINVRRTKRSTEVVINCSPVYAGEHLKSELWSKAYATIVTSATIRSLSKFDAFTEQAGLPVDTPTLLARSPFDYQNNGVLFIPVCARFRPIMKNIRRRSSNSFPNWCFGFRVASCCSPPAGRWKKSARRCLNTFHRFC